MFEDSIPYIAICLVRFSQQAELTWLDSVSRLALIREVTCVDCGPEVQTGGLGSIEMSVGL
jgi:hypothetical protein